MAEKYTELCELVPKCDSGGYLFEAATTPAPKRYAATMSEQAKTHKVIRTEVWPTRNGKYGVLFEFDDGSEDAAEVGSKQAAEWYAKVQLGQEVVVGMNPLLLNAQRADELRRR